MKTAVTIGYGTPWRQVEAMLLEAASRTAGVRAAPPPRVLQTALQDFYVEYTLVLAPESAGSADPLPAFEWDLQSLKDLTVQYEVLDFDRPARAVRA